MVNKFIHNKACLRTATISKRRRSILLIVGTLFVCTMLGVCSIGAVSAVDTVASDDFVCPHLSWECEEISGFFTPSTAFVSVSVSDPVSDSVSDSLSALDTNSLLNISLVDNVTLLEDWHISGDVQLCLNGYMLDLNGHHVVVEDGGNLSLYDCGNRVWQFTDTAGIDGLWKVVSDIESDVATEDFTDDTEIAGEIDGEVAGEIAGEIDGEAAGEIADEIDGEAAGEIAGEIDGEAAGEIADEIDGEAAVDISIPSSITITGGIITNGSATNGGGVEVEANGNFTMFSGNIVGNNATENGGGVFVADGATFTNLGGNVLGNAVSNASNIAGNDIAFETEKTISPMMLLAAAASEDPNFLVVPHTGDIHADGTIWNAWNRTNTTGPTNDGNYILDENVVLTDNWTVPTGTTRLCLNGFVMNLSGYQILIPDGATLIIEDCYFEDPAHIHYFDHANETEAWVWNETNTSSPFQVRGGAITGGNFVGNGGAIDIEDGGNLTMLGGNIVGNAATRHYSDDREEGFGGGVFVRGIFELYNGNIVGNKADEEGGGVMVGSGWIDTASGTFIMHGGNITDNYSPEFGGGVASYHSNSFTMHGGKIANNTAAFDGGGVFIEHGLFTMKGGFIINNSARYGGGVSADREGRFDMIAGEITGNCATHFGSGVTLCDYEGEDPNEYGFMNISASGRVIIRDNYARSSGLPDNLFLPTERTIKISNGVTLESGSDIRIRTMDNVTSIITIANTNIEENKYFFHPDLIGNYKYDFESSTNTIYQNLTDMPDKRFEVVEHIHTGMEGITWYGWNNSSHITPNSPSYFVLTEDVVLSEFNSSPSPEETRLDSKAWVLSQGVTFICLNGRMLDLNDSHIYVGEGSRLIICECNHTTHNFNPRASDGLWQLTNSQTDYNITGGFITDSYSEVRHLNDFGGAIYINGGVVTMLNGNIVGNTASSAGGVYVGGGTFRMESGSIAGNVANWGGGAVEVDETGLFRMDGGMIRNNVVNVTSDIGKGGGICLGVDGGEWDGIAQFTMTGGSLFGNIVKNGNGCGVFCDNTGRITLSGTATIGDMDDIYLIKRSKPNNPIIVNGDYFTGSAKNITLESSYLSPNTIIVSIDDNKPIYAADIYSLFGVRNSGKYILAVKDPKNIVLLMKNQVVTIQIDVLNKSYGTVLPNDKLYVSSGVNCNISITPNTGYLIKSITYDGIDQLPSSYVGGAYRYEIPDTNNNHNIVITFDISDEPIVETHNVIIASTIINGTVAANRTDEIPVGETVRITAKPESGYLFYNFTVTPSDGSPTIETREVSTNNTITIHDFTMPTSDATVDAIFGLVGDANNDHEISIIDSACVGIHIIRDGSEDPLITDPVSSKCADVNGDGFVNVLDLYMINGYLVGSIDSFPAAAP